MIKQFNTYLAIIFRCYIGGIFIYASLYKINYAGEFAEAIASYELVPLFAVNIMALSMPWIEIICGSFMIAGIRHKSATVILGGLMVLFITAVSINLLRDTPIDCGCFHAIEDPISWKTLVRDSIWLLMIIHVYYFDSILHLEMQFVKKFKDI
ncbi:MAG: DoxX family membrane protein [Desulfobacterales bacterium]|nr:DoxX family membrane protein [Desulfobacterales bacterium]